MHKILPLILLLFISTVRAEPITLQLKWTHAFQFAGYYAALEKGYYRDARLDVRLQEGRPAVDPVKQVIAGAAQYGIGTSSLLLERHAGRPVVALAVIFQHSPQVLIAAGDSPTQTIHDLRGKRIMIEHQADEILAYLQREGISPQQITRQPHSFQMNDLVRGETDALSAYVTNEPYYYDRAGFRYQSYNPRSAGIDFYGDTLFTSEHELSKNPERVAAFVAATQRGWQYAMNNPEEIIAIIHQRYAPTLTTDYLRHEAAQMRSLMRTDLIAVGYMNPGRWRHIADTYAEIGLLPADFSLDGFLYEPNLLSHQINRLIQILLGALALLFAFSMLAGYILRINRRLARSLADQQCTSLALQAANVDVKRAEAAQRNLLNIASHEFRNPAAIIKASLDSLDLLAEQTTPAVRQRLDNIRLTATRLAELANNLIVHDRLQHRSLQPMLETIELKQLLVLASKSYGQQEICLELPPDNICIEADAALLRVALHNLIDNALSHNPCKLGPVVIHLETKQNHIEISVTDQGVGIPDKEKQRIFEPFYSASGNLGKGLGLAIVHTIASTHGGEVLVQDNAPHGTRMTLRLKAIPNA